MVKRNITQEDISEIFSRHCEGEISLFKPLTGGTFNSVYKVETKDSKAYIIKIAPDKDTFVLTYEKDIIKNELEFFELTKNCKNVRFPKIYGYNLNDSYRYKYIIMEFVEGQMLNKSKLSKKEKSDVMYKLGRAMAEIHAITDENKFGYMQTPCETFRQAYKAMAENVINDGLKVTKSFPCLDRIKAAIEKHSDAFDLAENAHLIHFDLWPGNIIVKDGELYSIIDCERCMFGDPVGDFISLDYISPFKKAVPQEVIDGYNSESEKKLSFNKNELTRFYLMRLYLGLIVYTETYYRCSKYSPEFIGRLIFGKTVIKNALKQLEKI